MTTQATTDDYLADLLSGSTTFHKIAADFDNESDCFDTLRNAAKTSLESFDEYLAFYNTCLDTDSTGTVETFVETNASRMLKNIVLRDSPVGRRYHITTAAELHHRIEAFHSIGVEQVSPQSVVFTIFEHLVDSKDVWSVSMNSWIACSRRRRTSRLKQSNSLHRSGSPQRCRHLVPIW